MAVYEVYSPVDVHDNELRNVRAQHLGSAPSAGTGQFYYNTATDKFEVNQGGSFTAFAVEGHNHDAAYVNEADHTKAAHDALGIDADTLDAQQGTFYLARANHTGTQALGTITGHDKAAHDALGIDADTVDGSQAADLLSRTNHTGTQTASTISDFDTQVRTSRLDQMAAPTSAVSANSQRLTNVADPQNAQDAATKAYVDAARLGLDVKASVRAATTANIANLATGAPNALDGVALAVNDRILVKDQSTGSQNGIYTVDTVGTGSDGAWSRAEDFDANAEVTAGAFTFVEEGTANGDAGFVLTTDNPITVGTTTLTFVQFSGASETVAGAGLTKTGNTIDVGAGANITVNADSIEVDQGPGSGLDADTLDGVEASGFAPAGHSHAGALTKFSQTIGDGSTANIAVTHNLGTKDVTVEIRRVSDDEVVVIPWVATDTNTVTVSPTPIAATNEFRVVVVG